MCMSVCSCARTLAYKVMNDDLFELNKTSTHATQDSDTNVDDNHY